MKNETGPSSSTRQVFTRVLGGFDRSKESHVSDNTVYDLLNLRPDRGQYTQTPLLGSLVDDFEAAETP